MNGTGNKTNIIEIDLVSLLKKYIIQWRAILLCAIVLGILAAGVKYVRDRHAYQTEVAELSTSVDEKLENTDLTQEETDAVEQAAALKRKIADLNEYISNSIYMRLDAMNTKRMSILYYIKADAGSDAADLTTVCSEMLRSDDSIREIRKAAGIEAPVKYVRELVTVSDAKSSDRGSQTQNASTDIMKIDFLIPEKVDLHDVETTIEKLISSYNIESLGIANGTIRKISTEVNVVMDSNIQNWQDNNNNSLTNYKNQYSTAVAAFSDEQKDLLDGILEQEGLDDKDSGTAKSKKADTEKEDGKDSESGSTGSSEKTDDKKLPVQPAFSVKYFAIGFILGVLLFLFTEAIYEILKSRWSSVAGFSTKRLGKVYDPDDRKRNFLLCDRFLFRKLFQKEMDGEVCIDRILTRAQMNAEQNEVDAFELWLIGFGENAVTARITAAAAAKQTAVSIRTVADGEPDHMISYTAEGKSVAIAVRTGVSRKKDTAFLVEMLLGQKTDYLGLIELI